MIAVEELYNFAFVNNLIKLSGSSQIYLKWLWQFAAILYIFRQFQVEYSFELIWTQKTFDRACQNPSIGSLNIQIKPQFLFLKPEKHQQTP